MTSRIAVSSTVSPASIPPPGHDRAVLGRIREVEDEQLVEPRLGMLARDVRGDGRSRSQLCCARILALCSRLLRLVPVELLARVHVAERRMGRRQPSAAGTPNRFHSTAESALIFMSPNPGSAGDALLEISRHRTPRARAATRRRRSPPRRGPRASCTRVAIEPGKRCTAGFSRNAASTCTGSRCAISSVPEALLDLERPGERGLDGHLLVEREARSAGRADREASSSFALVAVREIEPIGGCDSHAERLLPSAVTTASRFATRLSAPCSPD